jgi:DNA-binding beta-propeller fold protein YncE
MLTRTQRTLRWSKARALPLALLAMACGGPIPTESDETTAAEALATPRPLAFEVLGSATTGVVPGPGAEIAAYDPGSYRVFSVNPTLSLVDVLDISNPEAPTVVESWSVPGIPNSVAVSRGYVAVAVAATERTNAGVVQLLDAESGELLGQVTVGAQPDMVVFSPNGRYLLVANEGEPSDDYTIDPVGSVSVIRVPSDGRITQAGVRSAEFSPATPLVNSGSIRVFGPGATLAQDLEPEYIAISHDSKRAWVTLQENNAIAVLDLDHAEFERVVGLGFKDWSTPGNRLDSSDRDGPGNTPALNLVPRPVFGMYQPDGVSSYRAGGTTYLVTANEGDARAYPGFSEETRGRDLATGGKLDPASPAFAAASSNAELGRLRVTNAFGDSNADGLIDNLFAFGARSFSIWSTDAELVYDSGAALEEQIATLLPTAFNSNNDANNSFDTRSDDKGPEPESVTVQRLFGRSYAFLGLERVGGVIAYDVSEPTSPVYAGYVNRRDFTTADLSVAGDLGPEGLFVIPADQSPNGDPILVLSNEVSVTTTLFRVSVAH